MRVDVRRTSFLFAGVMLAFSLWILSLPVFPTQDGPMHRYYIHVLDAVLHGSRLYGVYQVRHPFPPYATHYATVLALSHAVSYDAAEKIFAVLIILCFGYGLRFCALGCGRAGGVVSLFAAPLLLHWALMMGFMNYSLALGLFLFAAGCWQRAVGGRPGWWALFAVLVSLLTVTHPVPLLILTALCVFDLLLRAVLLRRHARPLSGREIGFAGGAIVFCLLAFQVPAAALQKHAAGSVFADMGIHARTIGQCVLLAGVSPYYTVSHALLPNLHRLALYAIFGGSLFLGARAFREHWAAGQLRLSDSFLLSTVLLAPAIAILPDYVNGSGFFATRMVVLLWIGALVAASGLDTLRPAGEARLRWAALGCALVSLLAAQVYFRPEARELQAVERQPMPAHPIGLLLTGVGLDTWVHHHYQTAPDPFAWGPALAFVRADGVILDSPWIDQNIAPLQAVPGSPLLIDDIRMTHLSKTDPGWNENASLPASRVAMLLAHSSVLLDSDTPEMLAKGIGAQLQPKEAARYRCTREAWYLVCGAAKADSTAVPTENR